jgi:hypothetical protein
MSKKKELGQFFTSNAEYIVGNLINFIPYGSQIIEPFCGNEDLIKNLKNVIKFDLDPKNNSIEKRDTLLDPPDYEDKWILTNPPFLSKNKTLNYKELFNHYKCDDLYKCALLSFVKKKAKGGIVIVPSNFFCDEDNLTRKRFLDFFKIKQINFFNEKVFEDTSYNVCSFFFERKNIPETTKIMFFPSLKVIHLPLEEKFNYKIGGDIFQHLQKFKNTPYKITRLQKEQKNNQFISPIFLRAIDTGSEMGRISLSLVDEPFFAKNTERVFATICFDKKISNEGYEKIVSIFNKEFESEREKFDSLFLTNFRNSGKYARKRVSFDFIYCWINKICFENAIS